MNKVYDKAINRTIDKPVDQTVLQAVWEALCVGDALGMPVEFMTRNEILCRFKRVDRVIPTSSSKLHQDLPDGSVTDDSEQNIWLAKLYAQRGRVTVEDTVKGLQSWIEETDALEKKYIGPSALRALNSIRAGMSPYESGKNGTTCGGIMRVPCVVLFKPNQTEEELLQNMKNCLIPTHHTWEAMEAGGAYAFAMRAALMGKSMAAVIDEAVRGAGLAIRDMELASCAPSSAARMLEAVEKSGSMDKEEYLTWLYNVLGTGLPSAEVCSTVFGIFAKTGADVFEAISMGASAGGDTDTIAALAGALSAAYAHGHNIPEELVKRITESNGLRLKELAQGAL